MRSPYFDNWKGAAILAVIVIHACSSSNGFPAGSFDANFGIVVRQIVNWPVALFVFLAAYFAVSPSGGTERYVDYIKRRLWRLILPYLVWSAIYCGAFFLSGRLDIADIPLMLATGTTVSVGYYVIVLIQLSLLSPIFEKLSSRVLIYALMLSIFVSCCFTYSARLIFDLGFWGNFPGNSLPFFVLLPFYLGGLLAARHKEDIRKAVTPKALFSAYFLFLALSFVEGFALSDAARDLAVSQVKLTSMLASGCICLIVVVLYRPNREAVPGYLSWLGQRSYFVYLSHILVMGRVQGLLRRSESLFDNQMVFIPLVAIITAGLCVIAAVVLDRMFASMRSVRRGLGLA